VNGHVRPEVTTARRWFWGLVVVAVVAMAGLYVSVQAPAGPLAAVGVAGTGLVLLAATTQAARILVRLDGRRSGLRPRRRGGLGADR